MKNYAIFLFFLFVLTQIVDAQDDIMVSLSVEKWDSVIAEKEDLYNKVLLLNKQIIEKDSINNELQKHLYVANDSITKLSLILDKVGKDTLILVRERNDLKSIILSNKNNMARVDTITIQMIITYMNLKCSPKRIGILRNDFANISSQDIKNEYRCWDDLLSIYSLTYDNVRRIVIESKDEILNAEMPPLRDKYILEAKEQISALAYVKQYYNNEDCNSPYLSTMIDASLEVLSNSVSEDGYSVFFNKYPEF